MKPLTLPSVMSWAEPADRHRPGRLRRPPWHGEPGFDRSAGKRPRQRQRGAVIIEEFRVRLCELGAAVYQFDRGSPAVSHSQVCHKPPPGSVFPVARYLSVPKVNASCPRCCPAARRGSLATDNDDYRDTPGQIFGLCIFYSALYRRPPRASRPRGSCMAWPWNSLRVGAAAPPRAGRGPR